jgi:hypothetical protein
VKRPQRLYSTCYTLTFAGFRAVSAPLLRDCDHQYVAIYVYCNILVYQSLSAVSEWQLQENKVQTSHGNNKQKLSIWHRYIH